MSGGGSGMAFPAGGMAWAGGGVTPALQERAAMRLGQRAEAEQQNQFGLMLNQAAIKQSEEGP